MVVLFCTGPLVLCPGDSYCVEPIRHNAYDLYLDNPEYAGAVDRALIDARSRLQDLLSDSLDFRADVYLVDSRLRFEELMGDGFPDWGAAAAVPSQHLIVVKSPDHFNLNKSLSELIAHEYAHLALSHRTLDRAPRWFDEGLAQLVSMEWDISESATMSIASLSGGYIPLQQIEHLNRFPESRARLAYAQSYLAVQYLYQEYGIEQVNVLLDTLAAGSGLDRALVASTGSDLADFEAEYQLYLRQRFNLVTLIMDSTYFWLALVLIFVVGAILTIRRRRKYYRQWEEDEKLASTDFDYGDPDNPEEIDDDEPWRSR